MPLLKASVRLYQDLTFARQQYPTQQFLPAELRRSTFAMETDEGGFNGVFLNKGEAQKHWKLQARKFHLTPNPKNLHDFGFQLLILQRVSFVIGEFSRRIIKIKQTYSYHSKAVSKSSYSQTNSLTRTERPRIWPPTSQQKRNGIFQLYTWNRLMTLVLVGVRPYFEEVNL